MKPDQLIKRRGKLGLIQVDTDFSGARTWIEEHAEKTFCVSWGCGKG